jgi:hypothetical protein
VKQTRIPETYICRKTRPLENPTNLGSKTAKVVGTQIKRDLRPLHPVPKRVNGRPVYAVEFGQVTE